MLQKLSYFNLYCFNNWQIFAMEDEPGNISYFRFASELKTSEFYHWITREEAIQYGIPITDEKAFQYKLTYFKCSIDVESACDFPRISFTGKVTKQGQPIKGNQVLLYNSDMFLLNAAYTDTSGIYSLYNEKLLNGDLTFFIRTFVDKKLIEQTVTISISELNTIKEVNLSI